MKSEPLVERNKGDSRTSIPHSGEFFQKVYVYKNDQQLGPYSEEQIQALLREHTLDAGDLAWADGWVSYMPIENVFGFMVRSAASSLSVALEPVT